MKIHVFLCFFYYYYSYHHYFEAQKKGGRNELLVCLKKSSLNFSESHTHKKKALEIRVYENKQKSDNEAHHNFLCSQQECTWSKSKSCSVKKIFHWFCCPKQCTGPIHTPRRDISTFYSTLHKIGSSVVAWNRLAPWSSKAYAIYTL